MEYFTVKNWLKHQHYKDRRPPWIKLHQALFDDYDFACLQDASKLHLILIWLLASRSGELDEAGSPRLPADPKHLQRALGLSKPIDLKPLFSSGFLVMLAGSLQGASKAISKRYTETETETETERELKAEKAAPSKSPGKQSEKVAFAPRVYLTEQEHAVLTERYGVDATAWMIERLDAWKDGKGLSGKGRGSDAGKIRTWVVDAWEKHVSTRPVVAKQSQRDAMEAEVARAPKKLTKEDYDEIRKFA